LARGLGAHVAFTAHTRNAGALAALGKMRLKLNKYDLFSTRHKNISLYSSFKEKFTTGVIISSLYLIEKNVKKMNSIRNLTLISTIF